MYSSTKCYDAEACLIPSSWSPLQVAFVQEYRSEKSLQALTTLLPPHATSLRDGKVKTNTSAVAAVVRNVYLEITNYSTW